MRLLPLLTVAVAVAGCPGVAPYSARYAGSSDTERKLLAGADRNVYPEDVRKDPEAFRKATLAWPGIVVSSGPNPNDPVISDVVIEHHYWDWIEDHSIQKARAFMSPRGEGQFVCHAERRAIPSIDLRRAMAVAYVRPVGIKDGALHAACIVRFFPPDWYATDVMDYGRDGQGLKVLRVPMN